MEVHRSAVEVVVQTPAKLNLFFEVLAKRTDGYHEIETLMCPINLYDTLYFKEDPSGELALRCQWATMVGGPESAGFDSVPSGPENLAMRAVDLLRRRAGCDLGASLRLVKRIPAAAGLGGGSSDAAAALVAANLGWKLGLSAADLAAAAAQLGSDVPFFLSGGPAVCRGRGERTEPVGELGALDFVVARPPAGLATAAVYGACRPAERPRPLAPLLEAFRGGDRARGGELLWNRLQGGGRTTLAVDRQAPRGVCKSRFSRTWNEWKRNSVLWAMPSRPPCKATGAALALGRHRKRFSRTILPLTALT